MNIALRCDDVHQKNTEKMTLIRHDWEAEEVSGLFDLPFNDLIFFSAKVTRENFNHNEIQISNLFSIKTGSCPEDCKYCPQSAHYNTDVKKESLPDLEKIITKAQEAKKLGASRFCMGAAWRSVSNSNLPFLSEMIKAVKNIGLETCVTLGMVSKPQLKTLKEAGLDYYNHNIDTSEEFYKKIITTRKYEDRLETLNNIREVGLKTCCGGIIGMGESRKDRITMLMTLANFPEHPKSVPINMLIKVKGTPMENTGEEIDSFDFIRTVAVSRIMMPESYIRLSAGRESMNDEMQSLCFFAGANSIFYGDKLLTAKNSSESRDDVLLKKLGLNKV